MVLDIKLDESYKITSDPRQHILAKKIKNGSEYIWKPVGFYSSLNYLIEDFISRCIRASDVSSIKELLDHQKSLIISLNESLKPIQIKTVGVKYGSPNKE